MSIWSRLSDFLERTGATIAGLRDAFLQVAGAERRKEITFTIAMIALSAKMAKADGIVSFEETEVFRQLFAVPEGEQRNVERIYRLAAADVAGFETYAGDVARLLSDDPAMLEDILDALFAISKADGAVHEREIAYLERVAEIFGFGARDFARIRARHVRGGKADPWLVLGADPSWSDEELRAHHRKLVRENHPDRLIARNVPEEFVAIANDRLAAINAAWEAIGRSRREPERRSAGETR
ncbi:TerB family tellurite resistance protein [Afifella sp. IM 167]|uniref:TerB family tellurite resistance protein n=1 Tax=Afifella sp. IM 167 TaxID=2033586 RepID=UPI001CCE3178|nr:TerB family tellurite resistance protein [Afifella sp. IM 167]MBZ8131652.1 molecular chaperone DjlA [Afifella sp. IM 167]